MQSYVHLKIKDDNTLKYWIYLFESRSGHLILAGVRKCGVGGLFWTRGQVFFHTSRGKQIFNKCHKNAVCMRKRNEFGYIKYELDAGV